MRTCFVSNLVLNLSYMSGSKEEETSSSSFLSCDSPTILNEDQRHHYTMSIGRLWNAS